MTPAEEAAWAARAASGELGRKHGCYHDHERIAAALRKKSLDDIHLPHGATVEVARQFGVDAHHVTVLMKRFGFRIVRQRRLL